MKEEVTEKRLYKAPKLTVVHFKTERGYANSGDWTLSITIDGTGDQDLEDRGTATGWTWD